MAALVEAASAIITTAPTKAWYFIFATSSAGQNCIGRSCVRPDAVISGGIWPRRWILISLRMSVAMLLLRGASAVRIGSWTVNGGEFAINFLSPVRQHQSAVN